MSQCCFDCQNELECLLCQQYFNNRGRECQLILNTDKHEARHKTGTSEANLNKCLLLLRGSDPNGEEAFIISLRSRRRLMPGEMQYPQRLGYSKCFPLRFVLCIFLWNKWEKISIYRMGHSGALHCLLLITCHLYHRLITCGSLTKRQEAELKQKILFSLGVTEMEKIRN